MEKYAVSTPKTEGEKTAGAKTVCPKCGTKLSNTNVKHCPKCGTAPFEALPTK